MHRDNKYLKQIYLLSNPFLKTTCQSYIVCNAAVERHKKVSNFNMKKSRIKIGTFISKTKSAKKEANDRGAINLRRLLHRPLIIWLVIIMRGQSTSTDIWFVVQLSICCFTFSYFKKLTCLVMFSQPKVLTCDLKEL